jgi:hypothetical protein
LALLLNGFKSVGPIPEGPFHSVNDNAIYFDPKTATDWQQSERLKLPAILFGATLLGAGLGAPFKVAKWGATIAFVLLFGAIFLAFYSMAH